MSDSNNIATIKILDRSYKIKCTAEQAHELHESAQYVDDQMRKVRQAGATNGTDRAAVVVALNISHELLQLKKQKNLYIEKMHLRIQELQQRIQKFLATEEEIAL